jgi:hypothetical protein
MKMKRIAMVLAAAALVVGTAAPASAGQGHGPGHGATVVNTPVTWTLTSSGCSKMPPGTTLNGSGTRTDIFKERNHNGVTALSVDSHAEGAAHDQDGNAYTWTYDLHGHARNTMQAPGVFNGIAVDAFRLSGDGPIRLRNGFVARTVEDRVAGTFAFNEISSYGDPFNFPSGPGRCDPL